MAIDLGPKGGFFPVPRAEILVVLLHAYNHTPRSLDQIAAVVRDAYPVSDLFAPHMPVSTYSWADPESIAAGLVRDIDQLFEARRAAEDGGCYRSIILIGHSLGAVMARKVWALAHGAAPNGEIVAEAAHQWAKQIDRIVLLAAMNRGWMISSALSPAWRLLWSIGTAWGNICRFVLRKNPLIFGFRRGAAFLTTTRVQCLNLAKSLKEEQPLTVQLLGTADDYVSPTDNVDLATGQDFLYLEVTEGTHRGIVTLEEGDGDYSALSQFRKAITADRATLFDASLKKEDVFDLFDEIVDDHDATAPMRQERKIDQVVFVVHGIRDRGFWTRRIARRVKELARKKRHVCRTVTSTYGYFPMGPFLAPWMRMAKVEWLLDQYVTAKALYPNADFAYIGHSNGTYLLAKALEICPATRFERVVFAGSVVQTTFDWRAFLPRDSDDSSWQVGRIANYVATADWVVAIFPHGLERLRLQDLGGAGHSGFNAEGDKRVTNVEHVVGGHGAALVATNWDEMAEFVLGGDDPRAYRGTKPNLTVALLGRLAPVVWAAIGIVIAGLGALILEPLGWAGSGLAIVFALYLSVLRIVATEA